MIFSYSFVEDGQTLFELHDGIKPLGILRFYVGLNTCGPDIGVKYVHLRIKAETASETSGPSTELLPPSTVTSFSTETIESNTQEYVQAVDNSETTNYGIFQTSNGSTTYIWY